MKISARDVMADWLQNATPGEIEQWADIGLRHKSGIEPSERLRRFLNIARNFGYATRDDSWGEFEKEFCIIIKRLVVAERDLEALRAEPPMCKRILRNGELVARCEWCGTEEPTYADTLVCREKPCRITQPNGPKQAVEPEGS